MQQMLPFQFSRFDSKCNLLVNESGEYIFIDKAEFQQFIQGQLTVDDKIYYELKSRHFFCTSNMPETVELISAKYRSRKRFIANFTALHMMVITLRCGNDCKYCQVSAERETASEFDMSIDVARKIVDYIFKSPSPNIKIEFQGGEPSLNWETLKDTVIYAEKINRIYKKHLEFVVCTNLTSLTKKQLIFYKEHDINISTSLDGPRNIHDKNRVLKNGQGTYDLFLKNLDNARGFLGAQKINALMTTTNDSLNHLEKVIDEYIAQGFNGIFIRSLNPYGLAVKNATILGYSIASFVSKYEAALNYIIDKNLNGTGFVEFFATLLLSRILTPFSTGFVDLQSPSGAGISGAIYDHNGNVFPADEARMLERMGDSRFLMGNVKHNTYEEIFSGELLREVVAKSCVEILPYCSSCVYRSYCGSDPIRNYLETTDLMGRRPDNDFCLKNKMIFDLLLKKIKKNDPDEMDVLWSWVSRKSLRDIRGGRN